MDWFKSNEFTHVLIFRNGGAGIQSGFEVFVSLTCFISFKDVPDD